MPGLNISKLADLAINTFSKITPGDIQNLMVGQSYILSEVMREVKPREMNGTSFKFNAIIKGDDGDDFDDATETGFGVYDGSYDTIPAQAGEYQVQGEIPWPAYIGTLTVSEKELLLNTGKEAYHDLLKGKREAVLTRMANGMERHFWSTSGYLHESDARPWLLGPEYWITDHGYHTNDAAGNGTEVAGIDPTDSDYNDPDTGVNRWRNNYQEISAANELIDAMDELKIDCQFKSPPNVSMATQPEFRKFKIIFNKNGFKAWVKLMRRLKEPFDELNPSFRNIPVQFADKMAARSDSTNQGFFFNLAGWRCFVAKGKNMNVTPSVTPSGQPSMRVRRVEYWPAIACVNRRIQGKVFGFGDELIES